MRLLGSQLPVRIAAGGVALAVPLSFAVAPAADAAPAPAIKVTQNYSETIVANDGISCNTTATGVISDNQYYRRFDMSTYNANNGFQVSSMTVGVELADSSTNNVPGDLLIYAIPHATADPFTVDDLGTAVASVPVNYFSPDGGLITTPISASIPAGSDMVIEASVDDGGTGDAQFYPGANEEPELGPVYLTSEGCGITDPTPIGDIVGADLANIMFVHGKTTECLTADAAVAKAEGDVAAAKAGVTKATAAVAAATDAVAKAGKALKGAKAKLKKAKKSHNASKVKKAKKKVKKAKQAAKAAKAALAAANAAVAPANAALAAANAKLAPAQAAQTTACAQPALPALPRPTGGSSGHITKPSGKAGFSFSSAR
jgi:hypothetical protein